MGGEITNQSGKGDKRIFQTLKEKSLDLPKEESLGIFSNIYLFLVLLSMTGRIQYKTFLLLFWR